MFRLLLLGSLLLACLSLQPQSHSSAQTETLVNVCAANYFRNTIAFDSIVAAFGSQLATATVIASDADPQMPGIQLPTVLGGVSVRVAGKLAAGQLGAATAAQHSGCLDTRRFPVCVSSAFRSALRWERLCA